MCPLPSSGPLRNISAANVVVNESQALHWRRALDTQVCFVERQFVISFARTFYLRLVSCSQNTDRRTVNRIGRPTKTSLFRPAGRPARKRPRARSRIQRNTFDQVRAANQLVAPTHRDRSAPIASVLSVVARGRRIFECCVRWPQNQRKI